MLSSLPANTYRQQYLSSFHQISLALKSVYYCLLPKLMAFAKFIIALLCALALARIDPAACHIVRGKVSCHDCTPNYDLSGIKVSVKCDQGKNMAVATTEEDGSFKVDLPTDHTKSPSSVKCLAKLLGGPNQLYASRKNRVSQIVKGKEPKSYTISTPLTFFTSCPKDTRCKAVNKLVSSKTVDLPLPPEWGLAPSSYYVPFIPIIGIP